MVERQTTVGLLIAILMVAPLAAALPGALSTVTSTTTLPSTSLNASSTSTVTDAVNGTTNGTTNGTAGGTPASSAPTTNASSATPLVPTITGSVESTVQDPLAFEEDMVGFTGDFPVDLMLALNVHVEAVHADAGFALVTTTNPSILHALVDVMPGLVYDVRNGATTSDTAQWDSAQWDGAQWDGAQWDGAQWDAATWDSAQWDSAQWDAAQWDSSQWDSAQWDATHWDGANATMDPGFGAQWDLGAAHVPDAWNVTMARHTMTICVVDSGVDYRHPDLAANMKPLPNGSFGYDFVNNDNDPMDDGGHGTAMAGIAAAVTGNGHGIAGVSQASLYAVKVLDSTGHGTEANLALGIRNCVDAAGAKIVLLALDMSQDNPGVHDAIKYVHGKGAIVVAASGNAGLVCDSCVSYPAAYAEATAVGASLINGTRANFSNGGKQLDFLAPGVEIPSTWPGGMYRIGSGTSQASAFAAGAAALVWTAKPSLNNDALRDALAKNGAKDVGPVIGFDNATGFGDLRLDRSLSRLGVI
jgi:subtilisin family serine protease